MNGRVYDPFLGRMISSDPTVPGPFKGQAFNRYAYVFNNPLSLVDPSGFDPDVGQAVVGTVFVAGGAVGMYYTAPAAAVGAFHIGYGYYRYYVLGDPFGGGQVVAGALLVAPFAASANTFVNGANRLIGYFNGETVETSWFDVAGNALGAGKGVVKLLATATDEATAIAVAAQATAHGAVAAQGAATASSNGRSRGRPPSGGSGGGGGGPGTGAPASGPSGGGVNLASGTYTNTGAYPSGTGIAPDSMSDQNGEICGPSSSPCTNGIPNPNTPAPTPVPAPPPPPQVPCGEDDCDGT